MAKLKDDKRYLNYDDTYKEIDEIDKAIVDLEKTKGINLTHVMASDNQNNICSNTLDRIYNICAEHGEAIKITTDDVDHYINRGRLYDKEGDNDLTIADLDNFIEMNPQDAEAYVTRGRIYYEKLDLDLALADFTKAIEIDPKNSKAYFERAGIYYEKGNFDLAIADLNKAIEINPEDIEAYNNRGAIYVRKGEFDLAISDFTTLLS